MSSSRTFQSLGISLNMALEEHHQHQGTHIPWVKGYRLQGLHQIVGSLVQPHRYPLTPGLARQHSRSHTGDCGNWSAPESSIALGEGGLTCPCTLSDWLVFLTNHLTLAFVPLLLSFRSLKEKSQRLAVFSKEDSSKGRCRQRAGAPCANGWGLLHSGLPLPSYWTTFQGLAVLGGPWPSVGRQG